MTDLGLSCTFRQIRRDANMSQIRDKKGRKKGIETKNPINAKSVQLTRAARFCLRFSMYLLIGIISLPQNPHLEHCHLACCSVRHWLGLRSCPGLLEDQLVHSSGHTWQRWRLGKRRSVQPLSYQ